MLRRQPFLVLTGILAALYVFFVREALAATALRTDLATAIITPAGAHVNTPESWQTIYDYSGGAVPPGTRILADGKWVPPIARKSASGVAYDFPELPDNNDAGQLLRTRFSVERPISNYPTRVTVKFSLHAKTYLNALTPFSVLDFATTDLTYFSLFTLLSSDPVNLEGENTVVFTFDGNGKGGVSINGKELTGGAKRIHLKPPGATLLPGISVASALFQTPADKDEWYSVNAVRIEQLRLPLEQSATASINLEVPGPEESRISLEVLDRKNVSQGFVLRDALVAPGKYQFFWDGINQRTSQPGGSTVLPAGSYDFRLTTSKVRVRCLGDINNSTPAFNNQSYADITSTALAITPPGTATPARSWFAPGPDVTRRVDARRSDTTDSVQLVCVGYDSNAGQWVGADGTVLHTKTGDARMQKGRGLAISPPDKSDPGNLLKQFYFVSTSIPSAQGVVTGSLPGVGKMTSKIFTNPDWNRKNGFWPYKIRLGQVKELLGHQHYLYFKMGWRNGQTKAEWIFRNVRLYEGGQEEVAPLTFDASRFSPRPLLRFKNDVAEPILPGTIIVEDGGRTVHLKNAATVNYPLEYSVTPNTILSFDLYVIDKGNTTFGAGIGLDTTELGKNVPGNRSFFNFLSGDRRYGFQDAAIGAYPYPEYQPNTLYTDSIPPFPVQRSDAVYLKFLFQPGYYGLKISEDGKLLFACNNADNRLEVRDIGGDGGAIAKIPVDYPMFVCLSPEGRAGAPAGVRYVYVDSPQAGIVRIAWKLADNSFGKPEVMIPASEFAYPRGIAYSTTSNRLFICDAYDIEGKHVANQVVVVDPLSGKVLSRLGRVGGVDPAAGGQLDENSFTCPLTVDADSKGDIWVNDYYSGETRKYSFDAGTNRFRLLGRVLGPNMTNTSHFYWTPDAPVNEVWTVSDSLVRHTTDIDAKGNFTNQRTSGVALQICENVNRPFAHFSRVNGKVYLTFAGQGDVFEKVGEKWVKRFDFGANAGEKAREAGLIAMNGQSPTELDKTIAASGDSAWEKRLWAWSDLNGDGKMQFTADNPEFKIAFNTDLETNWNSAGVGSSFRADGAFLSPLPKGLLVISPRKVNGSDSYDWKDGKTITYGDEPFLVDAIAQDNRYYTLASSTRRHDVGAANLSRLNSYDGDGKLLWSRGQSDYSLVALAPVGEGLVSTLERSWFNGLVSLRNNEGDMVCLVFCRDTADSWSHGALRTDADTAYIGYTQVYQVTGLSTVKSVSATVELP